MRIYSHHVGKSFSQAWEKVPIAMRKTKHMLNSGITIRGECNLSVSGEDGRWLY